jgi:hypothetical protein
MLAVLLGKMENEASFIVSGINSSFLYDGLARMTGVLLMR